MNHTLFGMYRRQFIYGESAYQGREFGRRELLSCQFVLVNFLFVALLVRKMHLTFFNHGILTPGPGMFFFLIIEPNTIIAIPNDVLNNAQKKLLVKKVFVTQLLCAQLSHDNKNSEE